VLFRFLEQYLRRLEGPLALQVWGRYLQLVKDLVGSTREFKAPNFPALRSVSLESRQVIKIFLPCFRCLGVLAEKVTQTTAVDDKRIRKELQVDEMLSSEPSHLSAVNPG
jgi:hypothetical protein